MNDGLRSLPLGDEARPDSRSDLIAAGPTADSAVKLGPTERWVLETVRRRGTVGFVATMTVGVTLASVALSVLAMGVLFGLDDEVLGMTMLLAMIVPAVVAPPTLFATVRLTARLDAAGRLLRLAALTDPLTGVLNRRGFFEAIEDYVRSGTSLEVSMVDVDKFKQLNDIHGHAVGDLVLERVADWLEELAGDAGIVARMGGDEFAFVVPAGAEPRLPGRQSLVLEGIAFSLTAGHAELVVGQDIDEALAVADAALYALKKGR